MSEKLMSPKDGGNGPGKRDRELVKRELLAVVKEIAERADKMGDCGGLQGFAVLAGNPTLNRRMERLAKEAEGLGITAGELGL
jgi:hypothetical protein